MENIETLCNAIVIMAANDLRAALKTLDNDPDNQTARNRKDEVERFFRSAWYSKLTDISGEYLLSKLNEEVNHGSVPD